MGEFSEREEAFFRSGERVETLPAAEEPRATWWRRLFRPELRGWSTLPFDEGETTDYASYHVID